MLSYNLDLTLFYNSWSAQLEEHDKLRDLSDGATPKIRQNYSGGQKGANAFHACWQLQRQFMS